MTNITIDSLKKRHPSNFNLNECTIIDRDNLSLHTPYTYLIGWSKLNKWYYGSRHAINCHPFERYETRSNVVKDYIKNYGYPDVIQIRSTFKNPKNALTCEYNVLSKVLVNHKSIFLNKNFGDHQLRMLGKVIVKDESGNIFSIERTDPRYISGELVGFNSGMVSVIVYQ